MNIRVILDIHISELEGPVLRGLAHGPLPLLLLIDEFRITPVLDVALLREPSLAGVLLSVELVLVEALVRPVTLRVLDRVQGGVAHVILVDL